MQPIRSAEILSVGTELLLGQIVNTNAAWLARELNDLGVTSYYQTVVGDNRQRLLAALKQSASRSDLVILTGGLGPTRDDLTMATAAEFAGVALKTDEHSRQRIAAYFTQLGRIHVTDNNWKQALMPEHARVLDNDHGTAPGAILTINDSDRTVYLVLLPGPPSEMRPMFGGLVAPWIREISETRLHHRFVRMIGIGESSAESELMDLIEQQTNPTIAPYASEGEVVFRLTQAVQGEGEPDALEPLLAEVKRRLGDYIYEVGPRKMPEVVKDLLADKQWKLSLAESCTAGLAAAAIVDLPGASAVLTGGVVAYENRIKQTVLGVSEEILVRDGAVSEACALAMARGCRDIMKTEIAAAVTGIAGPDGGSPDKPVGTVWLAVVSDQGEQTRKLQLGGGRERIRRVSVLNVFNLIRQHLLT